MEQMVCHRVQHFRHPLHVDVALYAVSPQVCVRKWIFAKNGQSILGLIWFESESKWVTLTAFSPHCSLPIGPLP